MNGITKDKTEQQVPQGWKLVPVEPTDEMVKAYLKANDAYWHRTDELPTPPDRWRVGKPFDATVESYRAMLAASPAGPVSGFKVDMSLVKKWQRENNVVQEPGSREAAMVIIRHDENGRPTVWCDPEIADLVAALNTESMSTVASCSGHGYRPGLIILKDGRRLMVFDNEADYERAEGVFPLDINVHPVTRDDEFGSIDTSEREAVDPSEIIAAAGVATVGRQA